MKRPEVFFGRKWDELLKVWDQLEKDGKSEAEQNTYGFLMSMILHVKYELETIRNRMDILILAVIALVLATIVT